MVLLFVICGASKLCSRPTFITVEWTPGQKNEKNRETANATNLPDQAEAVPRGKRGTTRPLVLFGQQTGSTAGLQRTPYSYTP